jgi:hypothetical protein
MSSSSSSSSSSVKPEFKTIGIEAGQEYIEKALEYCIDNYPTIVNAFVKGVVPLEMLEVTYGGRGSIIGRKAGAYRNPDGSVSTVDQTVSQFRDALIESTIAGDIALRQASAAVARAGALAILFPEEGKVSREKVRSTYEANCLSCLQHLTLRWPSGDVKLRITEAVDLSTLSENKDLIGWLKAFERFCINSSGNIQMNAQRAEANLLSTKMSGLDLPKYVKAYRKAAENVVTAGSSFSTYRIVATFICNLNHSEGVFKEFYSDFLNKHKPHHSLGTGSLADAIKFVEDHFKEVILPESARKTSEAVLLRSARDVEQQLKRRGPSSSGLATVPFTVLATLLAKRKADINTPDAQKKAANRKAAGTSNKAETAKTSDRSRADGTVSSKSGSKTKPCFLWASDGTCKYGDKCCYSHIA